MLKKSLKFISIFVTIILLIGTLFVSCSHEFGASLSNETIATYEKEPNHKDGLFQNQIETTLMTDFWPSMKIMWEFMKGVPNQEPKNPLPVLLIDTAMVSDKPDTSISRITWFGHSAFLLEINGKNILLDPMLGESPSPIKMLGSKRYSESLPLEIEQLPHIHAVVISHDHYDHLDYETIEKIKGKVDHFYVPLGVGEHLRYWDIEESKIHEFNWWQSAELNGITFTCAPSRHFSGRGLFDRFETLWASWIIKTDSLSLYFSGDSGYGPHFKEIGEKYGPFDFTMMECGQYNEKWQDIHMMPEETVQAHIDVQGKVLMPIHWGAFTLSLHTWTDPVERSTVKAKELGVDITTPMIGQPIYLNENQFPIINWWEPLMSKTDD